MFTYAERLSASLSVSSSSSAFLLNSTHTTLRSLPRILALEAYEQKSSMDFL